LRPTPSDADSSRDLVAVSASPHQRDGRSKYRPSGIRNLVLRNGRTKYESLVWMNGSQVLMTAPLRFRGLSLALPRPDYFRCHRGRHVGVGLQISLAAFAALVITGSMFLQPAHAQSVPQGSYRTSCTDVRVGDRTLTAVCRIADGREQRTSLTDVNRCVGDIGNDNGALSCNHGRPMAPYRQDRR
jgi:hypothetical protein